MNCIQVNCMKIEKIPHFCRDLHYCRVFFFAVTQWLIVLWTGLFVVSTSGFIRYKSIESHLFIFLGEAYMVSKVYFTFLVFFFTQMYQLHAQIQPIVLSDSLIDYFVKKDFSENYEDKSCQMDLKQILLQTASFTPNTHQTLYLYNQPVTSAHWLRFMIVNKAVRAENFKLELFDFDLDEVSFFLFRNQKLLDAQKTGFIYPFHTRSVSHKNLVFNLNIVRDDTLTVYMRFYSHKLNVLEPVIRLDNRMLEYGLAEYMLLGIFYGLVLLILIFNFIYFLILRNSYFLYYVFFIACILLYLISKNGTGFQYLWPEFPQVNPYMDKISLPVGILCMLLFSIYYLNLPQTNKKLAKVLYAAMGCQVVVSIVQVYFLSATLNETCAFVCIQLSFVAGLIQYHLGRTSVKWYVLAFILLNGSFMISFLEFLGWIHSSIVSVYALNGGIVGQFICLTVGLAESTRLSYKQKNKALSQLIEAQHKTESMRIVELKRQMNPHFIFNALNSILHRIRSDKKDDAAQFLLQFSKLIRKTLDSSEKIFITLDEELDTLRLYLEIESMRLGNTFEYHITTDISLSKCDIKIPAFILQPFVENAIWHGLMPKDGLRTLNIDVTSVGNLLTISILDNGIGRRKAMEYKMASSYESKGIMLVQERLKLIEMQYNKRASVHYHDLYSLDDTALGTHVKLEIEI